MTLAEHLAAFAAEETYARLPAEVAASVKQRVLDVLGICLAASAMGLGDGVADLVSIWGGRPEARLVGRDCRFPAPQAALVNGTLAHSLDFDDTHLPSVLHPSACIVPAALAMAEASGRLGAEAIAAIAVGIEVTVRTGMGGYLPPPRAGNVFFERGWHATSICGTLGAAVTAGKLLGFDADQLTHALGIAASMSSGVIEANRAGGTVKRLHCGWAAHAGLTAALLVDHGYTGPPTVLEGRFGFYEAFLSGQFDASAIVDGLGERWELPGIFFKPYPANHYTHAGIDAARTIRAKYAPDAAHIQRIELGTAAAPLRTIGEPRGEKLRPRSGYHAQFSGPFTVATALLGGGGLGVSFEDFTDVKAASDDILSLAAKVDTVVDPACETLWPYQFAAVVRVFMADETVHEERVMANRGGPGNPLSQAELRRKFDLNAQLALPCERTERLAEAIDNLENADSVSELLELTQPL
ncbi:MAG: MmgE/PrpD family protein [Chloroflexi bacterium]|nr:MmgE/PrpD family protein [Chloroflexota bacterium]